MTEETAPEAPETDEILEDEAATAEHHVPVDVDALSDEISRLKDENAKLKDENAKRRIASQDADGLRQRLHTELVRATGRLADPTDLPYDPDHLEDADALNAAVEALLHAKPHLASRTPRGDVGQGNRGESGEPANLLNILKSFA